MAWYSMQALRGKATNYLSLDGDIVDFERADRTLKQRITNGPGIGCVPRCVVVSPTQLGRQ
jgi:hypothetical protein